MESSEYVDVQSFSPEAKKHMAPRQPSSRTPLRPNHIVAYLYLIAALVVFPLYSTHSYNTLAQAKLDCFTAITLGLLGLAAIGGLAYFLSHPVRSLHTRPKPFSVTDYAMLAFFTIGIISWQLSSYPEEAYAGSDYRHHGLVIVAMYVIAYFILSRCYRDTEWGNLIFLVGGCLVFWVGLQNFFGNDILGFQKHSSYKMFLKGLSTLGNLNFFSSYVCMFLPLACVMFLRGKRWYTRIFYYFCTLFGLCAMIYGNSDSGFFGIGMLILLLPMLVQNFRQLSRLMMVFAAIFLSAKLIGLWIHAPGASQKYALSGFSQSLVDGVHGWVLLGVLVAAAVVFFLLYKAKPALRFPALFKWIWFIFLAVAGVLVLLSVVWFSTVDKASDLGKLTNYLRFDDHWGSFRGYAWRRVLEAYSHFPLKDILVGTGLDTAQHIYMPRYYQEMMRLIGEYFENAHNEYLQYLATVGILGVASYLTVIVSCVARAFKNGSRSPILLALGMAVLCYALQGIFNISQTMTTPIFFVLLGMTEAANRRVREEKKKEQQTAEEDWEEKFYITEDVGA